MFHSAPQAFFMNQIGGILSLVVLVVAFGSLMRKKETEVKEMEVALIAEAKRKETEALKTTEALLRAREEESRRATEKEAVAFIKRAIAKTVELSPEKIDDALIAKAVREKTRNS